MSKKRLDVYQVEQGLFTSREKAQGEIMAGNILVNGQKCTKSGTSVLESASIELLGKKQKYVSRGGLKLEKALELYEISLQNKIMLDVGASTGGFTHCALLNGASKVFAVDVGYGQLAWQLRNDERVVVKERTNARYLTEKDLGEQVDFVCMDVSFISITKILPALKALCKENSEIVALIKPQFEAGKENIGKKGVVKDKKVHEQVITKILDFVRTEGWSILGLTFSPITGPEGNKEFLFYAKNLAYFEIDKIDVKVIEQVVADAWLELI